MISEDFEKLLDLYLKGRLSAKQKAQLEKLLDDFQAKGGEPYEFTGRDADHLWKRIDAGTTVKKSRTWPWIPMAAAIIIACTAALFALFWNLETPQLSNKIILSDGTLVWLRDGATLKYSGSFSNINREVTLTGEALFEVARDPEHPFVINCGRYVASVLGTSFNIKATDSAVELTVLTGKVKITSATTDQSVVVGSREHVVFSESKGIVTKEDPGTEQIESVVANTQYDMHFEDTRMDEIVRRVEGKFDVKIELTNEGLFNCMISADFTDQSLPVTLTMISEALGVDYTIDGEDVTIRGAGCPR
ncbi:MAG TPA: FecR family protein [Cyclobacteriaceae bacterium]|nr:FecR family protein [Cyclobacteriaceae bacterium]